MDLLYNNCLIDAKCESNTNGTRMEGSNTNGNWSMATFGCSKANCWNALGSDKMALKAMLKSKPKQMKFQSNRIVLLSLFFTNPK